MTREKIRVLSVTQYTEFFVTTSDNDFGADYRRSKGGDWEIRMGESWEVCDDSEVVEMAFQEFVKSNQIVEA